MLQLIYKYKNILLISVSVLCIAVAICFYKPYQQSSPVVLREASTLFMEEAVETEEVTETLVEEIVPVYICGAIQYPGVYYLEREQLIFDVVALAGGMVEEADATRINLAQVISPNQKIVIPFIGEDSIQTEGIDSSTGVAKVNINTATKEQLCSLSGIGPARADQIVLYRETNGPFKKIEDIQKVSGIGEKLYTAWKEYITVE